MTRAAGCRVWDAAGREYVDYIMALGAVALGYGHAAVNGAAEAAIAAGVVGPLPPVAEEALAEALAERIPWLERVRFLKTGAEAVAAAVRFARVAAGANRDFVLGCGYHGWLDWCQGAAEGVPGAVRDLFAELPFNDVAATRDMIRERARQLAAVVVEPVVVTEPSREWLQVLRAETERAGAGHGCRRLWRPKGWRWRRRGRRWKSSSGTTCAATCSGSARACYMGCTPCSALMFRR